VKGLGLNLVPSGGTDKFASRDDVVKAVRDLSASDVVEILNATARYGTKLPAAKNKFGTIGFCWGGGQSFNYAVAQPDLAAADPGLGRIAAGP